MWEFIFTGVKKIFFCGNLFLRMWSRKLFLAGIQFRELLLFSTKPRKCLPARISSNKITLILSSNIVGFSNDETNFPHKLFLTNRQVAKSTNQPSTINWNPW